MSKKMKFAVGVICVVAVGGTGGVGYLLYNMQQQMNESVKVIAQLEQDITLANDKANQAATRAKDVKKKLKKANAQIEGLQEKNRELEEAAVEIIEMPTVMPEPIVGVTETPQETLGITQPGNEFSDGKCYMDIVGKYLEIGYGRVEIMVMYSDADSPYDYLITIEGSNGASSHSTSTLTGNWDSSSSSIMYTGTRVDTEINPDGSKQYTSYDNQTGSLRFESETTLYWTEPGTGNNDRGPFTKM